MKHWAERAVKATVDLGGKHRARCAVARSAHELQTGLQFHAGLAEGEGMLFEFRPAKTATMWMPNTVRFPIDIVFVGPDRKISSIVDSAQPGARDRWQDLAAHVIELPDGTCRRAGINPGDAVLITGPRRASPSSSRSSGGLLARAASAAGARREAQLQEDLPPEWDPGPTDPERFEDRQLSGETPEMWPPHSGPQGENPMPGFEQFNQPLDEYPYPVRAGKERPMNARQKRAQRLQQDLRDLVPRPQSDDYLRGMHPGHKAVQEVHKVLAQFVLPHPPRLRFTGYQREAGQGLHGTTEGFCWVDAEVDTAMGHTTRFRVPVNIRRGQMIPPSILIADGAPYVLTQASVEELVSRGQLSGPVLDRPNLYVGPRDQHGPRNIQPLSRRRANLADHIDVAEHDVSDPSGMYTTTTKDVTIMPRSGAGRWTLPKGSEVQVLRDVDGHNQRYMCFLPERRTEVILSGECLAV